MADSTNKQSSYWLYLGLFSLVAISLFKKVLFTNAVLFYGEFIDLYYGAKELSIHLLKTQGLGAWNPYIDGGQPLLADANFAYVLYPGNLIFIFTSVGKGFSILLVLHHIIAAFGMYLCSFKLSKNSIISLSSALFFTLSGFYFTSMYRPPCFYALSWLPWVCWLWCIIEEHPRQGFFYLSFISVLQILTGEFQILILSHLCGLSLVLGITKTSIFPKRTFFAICLLPIAVFLLAAAQLLPSLEYILLSTGNDDYFLRQLESNSFHPLQLFQFILPIALPLLPTEPGYIVHKYLLGPEQHFFFISNHTGIVVFALALMGISTLNKRQKFFWVGIPAFFLILSLGAHLPLAKGIYAALLPLSATFTVPAYFTMPMFFFIPLLAALNIADHLEKKRWTTWQLGIPSLFMLILFLLNIAENYFFKNAPPFDALSIRALRDTFQYQIMLSGFLLAGLAICYGMASKVKLVPFLLITLALGELLSYAPKLLWTANESVFKTSTLLSADLVNLQPELIPEFRIEQYALQTPPPKQGTAQQHHVDQQRWLIHAMGPQTAVTKRFAYAKRKKRLQLASAKRYWQGLKLPILERHRLMGTRYFVVGTLAERWPSFMTQLEHLQSSSGLKVLYDKASMPTAWSTDSWQGAQGLRKIQSIHAPPPVSGLKVLAPAINHSAKRTPWPIYDAFHGYRLKGEVDKTSVLIVADNAYPGWEARIDNRPAKIGLAYGRFKALALPPGKHNIRFQFRSATIFWGGLISISSWLTLLSLFSYFIIQKQRRAKAQRQENAPPPAQDDEAPHRLDE